MKKGRFFMAAAMAVLILATACGSLTTVTPSRNYTDLVIDGITEFKAVAVTGGLDVVYTQKTGLPQVSVRCPDNMLDLLDIYVSGSKLTVKLKEGVKVAGKHNIKVTASSDTLEEATITGSGNVDINGELTAGNFSVKITGSDDFEAERVMCANFSSRITGSGDINVNSIHCLNFSADITGSGDIDISRLECEEAKASISGSGSIEMEGSTVRASFSTTGSGGIDAKELRAKNVTARTTGSGNIQCYAGESLSATVSGSGTIYYSGSPANVDKHGRDKNIKGR